MNSIPLTFDEHQINRTVFGGRVNTAPETLNLSVILINNSASHFKLQVYENLISCNFQYIISIERNLDFSTDEISKKYPSVKFIVPLEDATDGDMINIAMSEVQSDYVLVIKDSLYIPSGVVMSHLAERLTKSGIYCVVPRLMDKNKNGLPVHFTPGAEKNHFVIDSSVIINDAIKTVYPFDNIAIYNRKKFIELGGFDYTIHSPYWQNLDLAIRSWLCGEQTKLTTMLQFNYIDDAPVEDKTINIDYLRYYLKNELVQYKNNTGCIKRLSFYKFLARSSCGVFEAKRLFNAAADWVESNKYRFKMDLMQFVQEWSKNDENK